MAKWEQMSPYSDQATMGKEEWLTVSSVRGIFAWEVALGSFLKVGNLRCSGTTKTKTEAKQQAEHMYRVLKKERT